MPEKDDNQRVNIMIREEQRAYLASLARQQQTSVSEIIRELIEQKRREDQALRLRAAAEALAPDYRADEDLTAFNALDGEDFA